MTTIPDARSQANGSADPAETDGLSRRSVIGRSAAGVGIALSGSFAGLFGAGAAQGSPDGAAAHGGHPKGPAGYGPLVDDPAGLLSLPAGFSYTVIAESGLTVLESGEPTPSDPDGAASFVRRGGGGVLIVNHEVGGNERIRSRAWRGPPTTRGGRRDDDHRGRQGGPPHP